MADRYLGKTLPSKDRLLTNFTAITHPSQPNYFAMIAGDHFVMKTDNVRTVRGVLTIANLLEVGNATWGSYQENYPGNCFLNASTADMTYRRKHNPFVSFSAVTHRKRRCAKIVPATQLPADMARNIVPEWVFYSPNMNNGGHDTATTYMSNWLEQFLEPLLVHPAFARTLFLITFDEAKTYTKQNHVYAVLLGAGVEPGTVDYTPYTHYSQLATAERRWKLGSLQRGDKNATAFSLRG